MQTVQPASEAGTTEQAEAQIDDCANSNEITDASATGGPVFPRTERWNAHRKAEIVNAVRCGIFSLEEVRKRYALSTEEFLAWQHGIDLFGLSGLRVDKLQQNRRVRTRSSLHRSQERPHSDAKPRPTDNE